MFDREKYNKYDKRSKTLLLKILQHFGYILEGSLEDEYYKETDLKVKDPKTGKIIKWECEAKNPIHFNNVVSGKYKDIIFNTRKAKNQSNFYIIFSQNFNEFLIVSFKNILNSPVKTIKTDRGFEDVFVVDRRYLKYYIITSETEDDIKINSLGFLA